MHKKAQRIYGNLYYILHALPLTNVCSILVTKNSFKPVLSHIGGIDLSVNIHPELLAWSCNSQKETYKLETSIEHNIAIVNIWMFQSLSPPIIYDSTKKMT